MPGTVTLSMESYRKKCLEIENLKRKLEIVMFGTGCDEREEYIEKLQEELEVSRFHEAELRDPVADLYKQIRDLKEENEKLKKDLGMRHLWG